MAAPEYVPVDRNQPVRGYESPPRRPASWRPDRPGEVIQTGQPRGDRLGNQGPDQGYVLSLARRFEGKLTLTAGRARAGRAGRRRAASPSSGRRSSAGRRWCTTSPSPSRSGASSAPPPTSSSTLRKPLFEEVSHPHHYGEAAPASSTSCPRTRSVRAPAQVAEAHRADWRSLLLLDPASPAR